MTSGRKTGMEPAEPDRSGNGTGALQGLVVLDASQMLAGPLCGMRLGDLGADVLKIEPTSGEWTRSHGFANAEVNGHTTAFLGLNRNKRSVAVDLKNPAGQAVLHDLVRRSDVFIQNYRVGTADRLGIGYEQLASINPQIVYCSITGYGETGPLADRPGQDLVLQGYSGSMWSVGKQSDPPVPGALWAVDAMAAYQATIAILTAVVARTRSGLGQKAEVSMLGVAMDAQAQELTTYLNLGLVPERSDAPLAHAWVTAPYGVYETADSYMTVAQAPLHNLGDALDDDRLREMTAWSDGIDHRDEIYRIVSAKLRQRSTAEWLEIFDRHKLWAGPVYNYRELCESEHVCATNMVAEVEHPEIGRLRMPNVPIKLSMDPPAVRSAPPTLGEHTDEVLRNLLGYDEAGIETLHASAAVAGPRSRVAARE